MLVITKIRFQEEIRSLEDIKKVDDKSISKKEMDNCKAAGVQYVEMPVAYDALTVVVNPRNDWVKDITVAELKKIWEPGARGK